MMTLSLRRKLVLLTLVTGLSLFTAVSIAAEKMDMPTHTLLIEKLEHVLQQGDASGVSNVEVRLRLADLLAERARLSIIAAEGKASSASTQDRKQALKHYQMAVESTDNERRAVILMQMAHLHEELSAEAKATAIYARITRQGPSVYPRSVVGQAYSNWGDVHYRHGEFAQALNKFNAAKTYSPRERHGYITYRTAWCHLNLGHLETATKQLVSILRTPELLVRASGNGEVDASFHEDVLRDLVLFVARGDVTSAKIRLLTELSPENLRHELLRSLAEETERFGKKRNAIFVWSIILSENPTAMELVDGRARLATLAWGLSEKDNAVEQLAQFSQAWKKPGCPEKDECAAIKARVRKLVVDWNRVENERVSPQLAAAYAQYNGLFSDEYDMHFWAAQVSRILKKYNDASALYRRSSILAHGELQKKEDKAIRTMFEAALVAQIEMAESGGNLDVRLTAYDHYLDLNPKGERSLEVRYQRARVFYDKNRHDRAAAEFREVALSDTKAQADLRKKAADLALDALVLAKQEEKIEPWALEFANRFPQERTEYLKIARRAVLQEVAATSNNPKSSESDLERAARRLREINLTGASQDERLLIFKDQLSLATRTRDLDETERAADRVLDAKGTSTADREHALEKKVWVAEMRLEFGKAYRLTKQMQMPKTREEDRHLRLAYLAELAGHNPAPHYQNVLRTSKSRVKSELAAIRLVRLSRHPWTELKRNESILRGNQDTFANLVLELYARTGDEGKAREYLRQPAVRRHAAGQAIARNMEIQPIQSFDRRISGHRLLGASESLMKQTLSKRLSLLREAEQKAQAAIRSQDWRLQAITLTIVARENQRLYNEILKLPVPARLNAEQKKQYNKTLATQATPFKTKAEQVESKLEEFWSNSAALEAMSDEIKKSHPPVTRLLASQLRDLGAYAPSSVRRRLQVAVNDAMDRPDDSEVVAARKSLARDPFSKGQAEKLKAMESELGRDAMVAYLDARLDQLNGGGMR